MAEILLYLIPALPVAFLILEKPFGYISRLTGYLDSMYVFREGFSLYNLFSFFFIVGLWAYLLAPAPQFLTTQNVVLQRLGGDHWLNIIALFLVITRYGYFDFVKGVYAGSFLYVFHEIIWTAYDLLFYNEHALVIIFRWWPLFTIMTALGLGYFAAWRSIPRRKEIMVIAILLVWHTLWYLAGWHVEVNNYLSAPTPYTYSLDVNLIVVLSWIIPALVLIL